MSIMGRARRRERLDYWPGFVDALSTLLLVFIFLLSVFILAQFYLSQELNGRDAVLSRLNRQIADLTVLLGLERSGKQELESRIGTLAGDLEKATRERARLQIEVDNVRQQGGDGDARLAGLARQAEDQRGVAERALAQIEALNQQISALRRQLTSLEAALQVSQARDSDNQSRIADLGRRLNVALALKVEELSRYRSDFFGRLRDILGSRADMRVVGDRFVFQSELFFDQGLNELKPGSEAELDKLAAALVDLEGQIPAEINWVLRVDGHTDKRPIATGQFPSNWELSASRAISVVRYLISRGVKAERLVAAGFGEFQPIEAGDDFDSLSRNRRIELKLTER